MGDRLLPKHLEIVTRSERWVEVFLEGPSEQWMEGKETSYLKSLRMGVFHCCLYRDFYAVSSSYDVFTLLGMVCLRMCVMLANGEDFPLSHPTGYIPFSKAFQ